VWPIIAVLVIPFLLMRPSYHEQATDTYSLKVHAQGEVYTKTQIDVVNTKHIQGYEGIKVFVASYPNGRIDSAYLELLSTYCDSETLKSVVAIATAETAQGRETTNQSNFWGWFKGGNRQYDPPREEMAQEICTGIATYYPNLTAETIRTYTGNDNPENWTYIYNWAISQM
jgi:hypothetical protein